MGDTKVQGLARADAVIPGIYSVYIDQDNRPDGFTVKDEYTEPTDQNDPKRDMYLNNGGKCQPDLKPGLNLNSDLAPKLGLVSTLLPIWLFGNHSGNSFELASGKPLNESVFKNASGEEFKVGSEVWIIDGKIDMDHNGMDLGRWEMEISIGPAFPRYKLPDGPWKVTGFKIAGFTDDPERKRTENMSKLPDEKRKYAVIDAELESTNRVASYKKDYMKCAPDGTCETIPVYETRTAPLNDLRSERPSSKFGSKDLSKPEFLLRGGSPSFKF